MATAEDSAVNNEIYLATTTDVRFAERLRTLIDEQGGSAMRQRIVDGLGITASTLSQYLRGTTKPSFERLIALAQILEVTLDDLVFAQAAPTIVPAERTALEEAWDRRLARLEQRAAAREALVQRVGRQLAATISDAVRESSNQTAYPRMIADDESLVLERFSRHTRTLGLRMDYVVEFDGGGAVPGRFLPTIAQNLAQGRHYTYLLGDHGQHDWPQLAAELRRLLRDSFGLAGSAIARCEILHSTAAVGAAFVLYELDLAALKREEAFLYDLVRDDCSADGWLGAVQPPSTGLGADFLMDTAHLAHARQAFERVRKARATTSL